MIVAIGGAVLCFLLAGLDGVVAWMNAASGGHVWAIAIAAAAGLFCFGVGVFQLVLCARWPR